MKPLGKYEQIFHDTHNAQEGELFTVSTKNAIHAAVNAALEDAAIACEKLDEPHVPARYANTRWNAVEVTMRLCAAAVRGLKL